MRLIDADNVNWGRCPVSGYAMKEWLAEQPTIDAAPVVRCKDCKRRQEVLKPEVENGGGICMRLYETGKIEGYLCRVKAYDFCSYGVRKDGEG